MNAHDSASAGPASTGYATIARLLHWLVAGMIVLQFVLANLAENAEEADQKLRLLGLLANHKSVGITILALAIVRVLWRVVSAPPALPATVPRWQVYASRVSHGSLYVLLFAIPISGWLMSSASAYSVSWFGLFQLPDVIGPNPDLKHLLEEVHEVLAKVLFVLASLHIVAAFKHAVVDRDGIMQRMASIPGVLLFLLVIATGVSVLASEGDECATDDAASTAPEEQDQMVRNDELPSALSSWNIDHAASYIRFTGEQAGATFDGDWTSWKADIRFASDALERSSFDVEIDTQAVDTKDVERDDVIRDALWFDSANHPKAFYRAETFIRSGGGRYVADGTLTLKGQPFPVRLTFSVHADGDKRVLAGQGRQRVLTGNTILDRLAIGIGTGEWLDTEWVGQNVEVTVRVVATVGESP